MRLRILVLALGAFALGTDSFVIAGVLPTLARDLRVSVAEAGLLVTAFAVTYALASPALATLSSNLSRRRVLTTSLAFFTAANVLAALSPTFGILLLARVLAAMCAALYTPTASAVAASLAPPQQRGRALAIVTGGLTVATVLGVPLGVWIGTALSWHETFWFVVALGALASIGVVALLPSVSSPPAVTLRARLALLRRVDVILALGITLLSITGTYTVYTYLAALLQRVTRLDGAGISAMLLVFGVAGVAGNLVGGYGADRWGPGRTLTWSLSVLALALALFPFAAASPGGGALTLVIWGIAGWATIAPQQHRLVALAQDNPSIILSLNASALYLGVGAGASLGGLALHSGSFAPLGLIGAMCEVGALTIAIFSIWKLSPRAAWRLARRVDQRDQARAPATDVKVR